MTPAVRAATLLLLLQLHLLSPALSDDIQSSMRGHLEAFGMQGPSQGIDQVDDFLSPKEFLENYVQQNRPLLFKGAATKSPAFKKWTDEYLRASVPPRPSGDIFIEHSKKENRSQTYNYVHFKTFLDTYNTSNIYMVSDVPEYLLHDLVLPFPLQCKFFMQGGLDTHVVWFSSGGTSSVIHHDAYENINCLYRGRKTLVFLNTTRYNEQVEKIIDRVDGSFSSADVDKIDLESRPEFRDLEFYKAEMEPGDCLYIPLLWVHQVRSFDTNLAVNIWWPPREKYPLDICMPSYSTSITFKQVFFKTVEKSAREDVDYARRIFDVGLAADARTEAGLMKMLSGDNAKVSASQEFATAVSMLFKAMDFDMDGELSVEEMSKILKRKQYRPIYTAINNYNVLVFRMHEAAGNGDAADGLPRLLRTSISDDSVFAVHRTWQSFQPATTLDEDELDADDWRPSSGDRDDAKKDEL